MRVYDDYSHMPPLPGLTPNGRRVIVFRGVDKNVVTPDVAQQMKLVLMIGDIRLLEEQVGVAGDVYIFDASVATPAHFSKFTPTIVKKFLIAVQVSSLFFSINGERKVFHYFHVHFIKCSLLFSLHI